MSTLRKFLPLLGLALLGACADDPTAARTPPTTPTAPPRAVGMVQITLTGVGTADMRATVSPLGASGANFALTPVAGGTPAGSVQLRRVSASSVDVGTRGAGGERYLQAIFQVRNADAAGTPYGTPRSNLTFVPVGTASTISGTPVSQLLRQDGVAADPAIASQLRPTGAVAANGLGGIQPQYADVLQAFTEAEASTFSMPGAVTNRFPYGFVVRHATAPDTRTLAANPGTEQFDGRVTFAYRLPLANNPADDPFTISIVAVAMDDSETRVTQSFEEQTPAGQLAFEARALALGATRVTLFAGGAYTGAAQANTLCSVRTGGTAASPTTSSATTLPCVTSVSPATLVPGATATLTGINFDPTASNDTVNIGGTKVVPSVASATSLTVMVPCVLTGNVPVSVKYGSTQGPARDFPLQGNQRTVGIGEALIITNSSQVGCNELSSAGGNARYIVSVFSASTSPSSNAPFQLVPDGVSANETLGARASEARIPSLQQQVTNVTQTRQDTRHFELLEKNRVALEELRRQNPRGQNGALRNVSAAPVEPPLTRTFRVSDINSASICSNFYVVSATRVYYNGKIAIYEDDATPNDFKSSLNATMAANYQKIGDQFNTDMEPIVRTNFGDVLRRDAETDNNGVLVALFTPRINNSFNGVAGFVISCDQMPNTDAGSYAVGGPYAGTANANGASNFGQFFYAYQPVVAGTGYSSNTAQNWYRTIRSTFIHETKHVVSQAARVANGAPLEASWLEEGTARHVEELWGRNAVDNVAWKANTGHGSAANPINTYCDFRPGFAECDANTRRPASIMQRHFGSLYTHLFGSNARLLSPFGATASDTGNYWYAISWSLVRYSIDRYAGSEAAFFTALTESSDVGVTNLVNRTNTPIDRLLGGWSLALAADDHPLLAGPASPDIQMPTWNFRNIYAGFNADIPATYSQAYPLVPTQLSFGAFTAPAAITTLRGGGALWYEFSGTQTAPQLIKLQGTGGGAVPSTLRVAVTRIQ